MKLKERDPVIQDKKHRWKKLSREIIFSATQKQKMQGQGLESETLL